ncbi:MAG: hypothetical protein AAF937_10920 [Planctomycetota bacterium]
MQEISTNNDASRQSFSRIGIVNRSLAIIAAATIGTSVIASSPLQAQPEPDSQPDQQPDSDEPDPIDSTYDYLLWLIDILLG